MNSHIVHICSYNDRFLVIDQSGTFYVLFLLFYDYSFIDVIEVFIMLTVIIQIAHASLALFLVKIVIVMNLIIPIVFCIIMRQTVLL